MYHYIYDVFTKPRWELSITDTLAGVAVLFTAIIVIGLIGLGISWLSGKFDKKKKKDKKKEKK